MKYGNLRRRTIGAIIGAGLLAGAGFGEARAHGVESLGEHEKAEVPAGESWFSFLFSSAEAAARVTVSEQDGYRYIEADGLPDHATGQFPNRGNPNRISEQDYAYRVPLYPEKAARITMMRRQPFGVVLNGVPLDPGTAECWNNDCSSGWNVEALGGAMDLGLDRNNAHVQPGGAYHYHAMPTGFLEKFPFTEQPLLVGYAADGFPVYGYYGRRDPNDSSSEMVELKASYRIRRGERQGGPGGAHDGKYVQDYEYAAGLGDLDQCNGRAGVTPEYPDGTYYYVLTAAYPFIPRCFVGTPDSSFKRDHGPGGGSGRAPGQGQQAGGQPPGGGQAGGPQQGGGQGGGGRPDLNQVAEKLGVDADTLRRALGPPPPDLASAAAKLGISEQQLREALPPPPRQ